MAIKWNANKVSVALDEVEKQISLADAFLEEAQKKAKEAARKPNMPEYMGNRIGQIVGQLRRMDNVKSAIESARDAIPKGEIERWRKREKMGSTAPLFQSSEN